MSRMTLVFTAAALVVTLVAGLGTAADEVAASSSPAVARPIVYFDRYEDWYGLPVDDHADGSFLAREIVRQALMIAARDELGMLTRDIFFGEQPAEDGSNAYDVRSTYGAKNQHLSVVCGKGENQKVLLEIPTGYHSPLDYQRLIVDMEELSRTKFPEVIKASLREKVELPAIPSRTKKSATDESAKSIKDAGVPQEIEELLTEMSFISQFAAIRKLHAVIYDSGESPERLGALVRGYANLGLLTEYFSYPINRAFRARSLLYAQRMAAEDPKAAFAQEHRAYALALLGYHALALDALEKADDLRGAGSGSDDALDKKTAECPWVDLIKHYCRYECSQIKAEASAESLKQLAALLKFCSASNSGSATYEIDAGMSALRESPECYLISDRLSSLNGVSLGHQITMYGPPILGASLGLSLSEMPDAPKASRKAALKLRGKPGPLFEAFNNQNVSSEELEAHQAMIDGLLSSGKEAVSKCAPDENSDKQKTPDSIPNEFTYCVLGQMINETIFNQVMRRVYFVSSCWAVNPNELIDRLHPFVANHRYAAYIDYYSWDKSVKEQAIEKLSKASRDDLLDATSLFVVVPPAHTLKEKWPQWFRRAYMDNAETPYDFWCLTSYGTPEGQIKNAQRLQIISPWSPLAKNQLLKYSWEKVKDQADTWEQEASPDHPAILSALGNIYLKQNRYEDAERCFKKASEIENSIESLRSLAAVYYQQQKFDAWEETLNKALQLPDYSLAHASIENQIAWHYLDYRDPEKALPYAEAAAASYSGWGLETLATVDEFLQQWDKAEAFYRATSERYSGCGSDADWYFFCRRTGKGDVGAAKQLVETALNNPNNTIAPWNIILYRLLNKQTDQALELIETEYKKNLDPWYGLLVVNCTDEKQDTVRRDEVLKALANSKAEALKKSGGERDKALFDLAEILTSDLAAGGKVAFEQEEIEKNCPKSEYTRSIYYYISACYCDRRSKTELAKVFWQKAVTSKLNNEDIYRNLSAAALLGHGIGPEQYKDAWTTKPEKSDPK